MTSFKSVEINQISGVCSCLAICIFIKKVFIYSAERWLTFKERGRFYSHAIPVQKVSRQKQIITWYGLWKISRNTVHKNIPSKNWTAQDQINQGWWVLSLHWHRLIYSCDGNESGIKLDHHPSCRASFNFHGGSGGLLISACDSVDR